MSDLALNDTLATNNSKIQILVPVYNEGENVLSLYSQMIRDQVPFDLLKFIYDINNDTSLPFIAKIKEKDSRVISEKNQLGPGVIKALKWGFKQVEPGPVLIIMGDNSDKLSIIPQMIADWEHGAVVVSPSRYMRGGQQYGGGLIKSTLSKTACVALKFFGFPTADATNNFKLYDGNWLKEQNIESSAGFEVALELCYKAFSQKKKITELPTIWQDRTFGQSKFKIMKWMPHYLKWWLKTIGLLLKRKVTN